MAVIKDLKIPTEKVNPFWWCDCSRPSNVALGTVLWSPLINALDQLDGKNRLSLPLWRRHGVAIAIERENKKIIRKAQNSLISESRTTLFYFSCFFVRDAADSTREFRFLQSHDNGPQSHSSSNLSS